MSSTAVRSFQPSQLRGVSRENRTVDLVASSGALDSYGTRIDPAGWELDQFKKNPVMCLQHDSWRGLPVASALPESVRIENGKLLMTAQFPPQGASVNADEAFELIAAGVLRGVSVGFDPEESEMIEEDDGSGYKRKVLIYRRQRLLEVSFVTIPSNDDGLVVRARELNADPEAIKKQTENLEKRLNEQMVTVSKADWEVYEGYFARKKPANKASTAVLKKFFEAKGEEQPDDEVLAWKRMAELLDEQPEVKAEEKTVETPEEVKTEEKPAAEVTPPEPTPPTPPVPAAPEPERTASVQIPLSFLEELPGKLVRSYVETGVAALQRGVPRKDVANLIDGANASVVQSFSTLISHGNY